MDERERDSLDDMKKQSYQNSLGAKQAYINALEFHIKELEDRITAGMEFSGKQATQLMEADARVKELEDIIAETKRRKTDEEIMKLWDTWREYIANGGTASWPRDGFESVISWYEERIKELEEENKVLEKEVDRLQEVFQVLNEAHIKAESHIKELEREKCELKKEIEFHIINNQSWVETCKKSDKRVKELMEGIEKHERVKNEIWSKHCNGTTLQAELYKNNEELYKLIEKEKP